MGLPCLIRKGTSFGHAAAYLFVPGERGEHVDAHVVAGGNVLLGGPGRRDWVANMRFCAGLRPGVSRPVWHCLLRTAPQDPLLDDPGWVAVVGELVAALGLARHPWVAVRHGGNHVHVLAGRVNTYGEVSRDSRDYAGTMAAVRVIERNHGLVAVGSPGRRTATRDGRAQSPRVTGRSRRYSFPGRDHRAHVRFTADEYAELAAAAGPAGLTTTGYVGEAALAAARGVTAAGETDTSGITRTELAQLQRELFAARTALTRTAAHPL